MSETQVKSETSIYQLKVTLRDSKPPIWRRVLVPGDITLGELHDVIQAVMDWDNSHLHQFTFPDRYYSDPFFGLDERVGNVGDENRVILSRIVPGEKFKFMYEYDFGDSWEHIILVEKILPPDPGQQLPVCVKGARACPPEDVGGIWGYYGFLEALQDPNHPDHNMYLEWIDGEWDAEAFDLNEVNDQLQVVWRRSRRHR
ncbi:MAG: plasmid pRiA4b ORF-3 family protein [Anaerolineae bacterium]|nr:plasmid pRiA4b ORF-3 family protein [Anaerolineae bacterium]